MFRKTDIKLLSIVIVVLLAIVIFLEVTDFRKSDRTFRQDLVNADPEKVTLIEIYPRVEDGKRIVLSRENNLWQVESEGKKYLADPSVAGSLVDELNTVKPERVAAAGKDRWKQYQVSDSLATKVKLLNGTNLLAEVYIGKFTYSQEGKMTSYIRLAGENKVFGVDGMIGMSFNRNMNSFRNRKVLESAGSDWVRLIFAYPADSSFTLQKMNDKWMIDDAVADSASVSGYFSAVSNLTESSFSDSRPSGGPTHRLRIEGNNQMEPVEISGFSAGDNSLIIESSQNRGNYFNSPELVKKVFVGKRSFLK